MLKRRVGSESTEDEGTISNIQYNNQAGAQKNLPVGPALVFVGTLGVEKKVFSGDQLYIFNSTGSVSYVKMSETPSIGVVPSAPEADTFPVFANSFTPYSASEYKYIKGNSDLFLYILKDSSQVRNNP